MQPASTPVVIHLLQIDHFRGSTISKLNNVLKNYYIVIIKGNELARCYN